MKKIVPALIFVCILFSVSCAGREGIGFPLLFSPTPEPTPAPSPTPQPVVAVFSGKEHQLFYEGLASEDAGDGAKVVPVEGGLNRARGLTFAGKGALIVYAGPETADYAALAAAKARGLPLIVYADREDAIPEGIPSLRYDLSGGAEKALDLALSYEHHDAPVRLVGLFTSEESPAFRAFSKGIEDGKVFRKGVYVEGVTKTPLTEWVMERVAGLSSGTLDGIYAETAEGAVAAARAIQTAGLDGAEVYSAEVNDELLSEMLRLPEILVYAVGRNDAYAGRFLRAQAARLLIGLPFSEDAVLLPRVYAAATLPSDWAALPEG